LDFVEILESGVFEIDELAADHKVKQLRLGIVRHLQVFPKGDARQGGCAGARGKRQGNGLLPKCPTMRA
jgi:hypothetical protein